MTISEALAQELVTITDAADKSIGLMRKMFNGETLPHLADMLDVEALRQHVEREGVRICAEVYTTQEMHDLLAFYSSETGRSAKAKDVEIEQRMAATLQIYLDGLLND